MSDFVEERERSIFLQLVYVSLFVILVGVLSTSLFGTHDRVISASAKRAVEMITQGLTVIRSEWMLAGRPKSVAVPTTIQSAPIEERFKKVDNLIIGMNRNGWPKIESRDDCIFIWVEVFNQPLELAGEPLDVRYVNKISDNCEFFIDEIVLFEYKSNSGQVNYFAH